MQITQCIISDGQWSVDDEDEASNGVLVCGWSVSVCLCSALHVRYVVGGGELGDAPLPEHTKKFEQKWPILNQKLKKIWRGAQYPPRLFPYGKKLLYVEPG